MAKKKKSNWDNMEPQKSSAAQFITYVASVGESYEKYELRYENENIWMSQKTLAAVYGVDLRTISYHITKIFKDAELEQGTCIQKYWIHLEDGRSYEVNHYNLQVIIALGFKIDNEKAIAFRRWANQIVTEYTIKGWVMDDQRLKDGSPISDKYFDHLLEKIREIRLSERKFYQKITDLYATAIDYDKNSNVTRVFFATVKNRMHQAAHGRTAAQLIYERADAEKEHMGLTTWEDAPDGKIQKYDVSIAKNYLTEDELDVLERLVNAFIDFAELRTLRKIPMTMEDWKKKLEDFLIFYDRRPQPYTGDPVTAYQAQLHAETEFEKYKIVQEAISKPYPFDARARRVWYHARAARRAGETPVLRCPSPHGRDARATKWLNATMTQCNRKSKNRRIEKSPFSRGFEITSQDKLFMSDYDRFLLALEEHAKKEQGGESNRRD